MPRFRELLGAAVDRILPLEGGGPDGSGGPDDVAAVVDLFEERLGPAGRSTARRTIEAGLRALDAAARRSAGTGFAEVGADRRDALLAELEADAPDLAARFFPLVVTFTLEAAYGGPERGGTLSRSAWRHLGYEPEPGGRRSPAPGTEGRSE